MAIKKTTKTVASKVSKRGPKAGSKKRAVPVEEISTSKITSGLEKKMTPRLHPSKRVYFVLALLIGLVLIVIYGSKFMIVAWVDKKPITRLEYYQDLDKKYGKDLREQLIVEKLISDEAQNKGLVVTDADVNVEIKKFETEQGGQDKVDQLLQLQGLTRSELVKLVRLQLLRQKIFGQNITVSDDEVNKYINDNKDQFPQLNVDDSSTSAKIKNGVKQQLIQQRVNKTFSQWLQTVLQSSRVVRN